MMKAALIARSTLYEVPGGDTVQIKETATHLKQLGVDASILLSHQEFNPSDYDVLHFFNLIRPADMLKHLKNTVTPIVISPILVDYSEYDKMYRKGLSGFVFRFFSEGAIEYIKVVARWLKGTDQFPGFTYLSKGHWKSILHILDKCSMLLPNSEAEFTKLHKLYKKTMPYIVVPNGVNTSLFSTMETAEKDHNMVLCVGRLEGLKNQLTLIKALNNTKYNVTIIGAPSSNQEAYYQKCRKEAASNITFLSHLPQQELFKYYLQAKVHILPSWFETCGLSSLEAAAAGCSIVITDKGYTRDYFGSHAFYCDPSSPESILEAVNKASMEPFNPDLQKLVTEKYTWQRAAEKTLESYKRVLQ